MAAKQNAQSAKEKAQAAAAAAAKKAAQAKANPKQPIPQVKNQPKGVTYKAVPVTKQTGLPAGTGGTAPGAAPGPGVPAYVPVAPFLTPDQQQALITWNASYAAQMGNLQESDTTAGFTRDTGLAADAKSATVNTASANENAAARGIFQSSIRQGALNDIASTLAQQNNIINTNYNTTIEHNARARDILVGQNTGEQSTFTDEAVQNAQNAPRPATPIPVAPAPPKPAAPPAPAAPKLTPQQTASQENAQAAAKSAAKAQAQAVASKPAGYSSTMKQIKPPKAGVGIKIGPPGARRA